MSHQVAEARLAGKHRIALERLAVRAFGKGARVELLASLARSGGYLVKVRDEHHRLRLLTEGANPSAALGAAVVAARAIVDASEGR